MFVFEQDIGEPAQFFARTHAQIAVFFAPVLDWFHISMRARYLEQIIKGMRANHGAECGFSSAWWTEVVEPRTIKRGSDTVNTRDRRKC